MTAASKPQRPAKLSERDPAVLGDSVTLVLRGPVPAKKGAYRRGAGSGFYLDAGVASEIEALTTQARIQWSIRRPVQHARMEFQFFVAARRKDRDNLYTCILDCLVKASVLVNDNPVSCNGTHVLHPVIVTIPRDERVEITIEETVRSIAG